MKENDRRRIPRPRKRSFRVEGLRFRLEDEVDLEDEEVFRHVRDVLGLYADVDGDGAFP